MKKAHAFILGFVQGVGFRHFISKRALELELRGWVKNTPDNRVEACFIGEEENIKKAIEICKKGPFLSEVKNVDIEWGDVDKDNQLIEGFEIVS
ncbi:MAG: acylphosphatase [bacterium]|nr:acylphosphatase [bacterium]